VDKEFRILVHTDDDGSLWAEVPDMPGVFASGSTMDELFEAVTEAITMVILDGDGVVAEVERNGNNYEVSVEGPDLRLSEHGREMLEAAGVPAPEGLIEEPADAEVVDFTKRRQTKSAVMPSYKVKEVDLLIEA
jgi:predicted RNase H-like HicB family nuclease